MSCGKALPAALALVLAVLAAPLRAQLVIEINRGVREPIPIAMPPFVGGAADPAQIISANLRRSGYFQPLRAGDMLSLPGPDDQVYYRDWQLSGARYLLVGEALMQGEQLRIRYALHDIPGQRRIMESSMADSPAALRDMSHSISDALFRSITGIDGMFGSRILYITDNINSGNIGTGAVRYSLMMSDQDGHRQHLLFESRAPIMSPAWSPDGREVLYVSFEGGRPAIIRQRIADGRRWQVAAHPRINGAPSWSPDGRHAAMALSRDGNPEIYLMNLQSGALRRLTDNLDSDTEPVWSRDGRHILFTSDRSGKPQIHRLHIETGRMERMTFEGENARPRVAPDGRLVLMHRKGRGHFYRIAVQEPDNGEIRPVSSGSQEHESPSLAPNGAFVIYATKIGDRGLLRVSAIDAGTTYDLPASGLNVREPAWSP